MKYISFITLCFVTISLQIVAGERAHATRNNKRLVAKIERATVDSSQRVMEAKLLEDQAEVLRLLRERAKVEAEIATDASYQFLKGKSTDQAHLDEVYKMAEKLHPPAEFVIRKGRIFERVPLKSSRATDDPVPYAWVERGRLLYEGEAVFDRSKYELVTLKDEKTGKSYSIVFYKESDEVIKNIIQAKFRGDINLNFRTMKRRSNANTFSPSLSY